MLAARAPVPPASVAVIVITAILGQAAERSHVVRECCLLRAA